MSIARFTVDNPNYKYRCYCTEKTIDNFYKYIDTRDFRYTREFVYQNASIIPNKYVTFTYNDSLRFGFAVGEYHHNGMKVTLYTKKNTH